MAVTIPGASPLQNALSQLGALPETERARLTKDAFDGIARQTRVPANVLMALDEEAGGGGDAGRAQQNAAQLADVLGKGGKLEDAMLAYAGGDSDKAKRLLDRSYAIADAVYPRTTPAPAAPEAPKGPGIGTDIADLGKSGLGGALGGVAGMARGMGVAADETLKGMIERYGSRDVGQERPAPVEGETIARPAGRWAEGHVRDVADAVTDSISERGRAAMEGSQPGGELFSPSTWDLGADPSIRGYALNAMQGVGSMAPMLAARHPAASAAMGGLMSGGEGADNGRQFVIDAASTMDDAGQPEIAKMPEYQALVGDGRTHEQATMELARRAETNSGFRQALIGALGGAATNRIFRGAGGWLGSGGRLASAGKKGAAGFLEEGAQEAMEGVAAKSGIEAATGADLNLADDSFGNFLMGGTSGGAVGGAGGLIFGGPGRNEGNTQDDGGADQELGALPPPDRQILLPPPDAPAAPETGALPAPDVPPGLPGPLGPDRALPSPTGGGAIIAGGRPGVPPGVFDADPNNPRPPRDQLISGPAYLRPGQQNAPADGSGGGAVVAPDGVPFPSAQTGATTPNSLGAMPPPAGPVDAIARSIQLPEPEPAPSALRFPEQKAGSAIRIGDPESGQIFDAVFIGETPDGARIRIAGQEVDLTPQEFDMGRDAVAQIEAAQKAQEQAAKASPGNTRTAPPATGDQESLLDLPAAAPATPSRGRVEDMTAATDEQIAARLDFLTQQGQQNGWNAPTSRERAALEAEIARRAPPAPATPQIEGEAAARVEQAAADAAPEPTEAQKEAGNYRKGHTRWNGFDLSIENAKGSERRGTDRDGNEWSVTMPAHYGYFRGTKGADGDHVDFYMGDVPDSDYVMIVDQVDADTGEFDEHKVILGTTARGAALETYLDGFSDGRGEDRIGNITEINAETLKNWLRGGDKSKPVKPLTHPFRRTPIQSGAEQEGNRQNPEADLSVSPAPSAEGNRPVSRNKIKNGKALTARGREIGVEYAVVDLDSIIPSQRDDGRPNPAYAQELQPRDRTSDMSQEQIRRIAQDIRPELLGEGPQASNGAPIILPTGEVISGNGRILALRRAMKDHPESAKRYADWLEAEGYPADGMTNPVLVRVTRDDMPMSEAAAVAREANERDQQAMSLPEQALADAKNITPSILDNYQGGDVDSAANRGFVRSFIQAVVPQNEQAGLWDRDKQLTRPAVTRINAALLARAYGDRWLVGAVMESNDSNIRSIGGALTDVSANWAKMRADEERGIIAAGADRTAPLVEAVKLVDRARQQSRPIMDFVNQQDIFEGESVSPAARDFLDLFFRDENYRRPRGREGIAEALNFYAEEAMKTTPGVDMFGDSADTGAILNLARERTNGSRPDRDVSAGQPEGAEPVAGARAGEGGREGAEREAAPVSEGSGSQEGIGSTRADLTPAAKPQAAMDWLRGKATPVESAGNTITVTEEMAAEDGIAPGVYRSRLFSFRGNVPQHMKRQILRADRNPDPLVKENTSFGSTRSTENQIEYLRTEYERIGELTPAESLVGESWQVWLNAASEPVNKRVISAETRNGQPVYLVQTDGERTADILTAEQVAQEKDRDARNLESRQKREDADRAKADAESSRKSEAADVDGFTDGMTPMQAGKVLSALNAKVNYKGRAVSRRDLVREKVADGAVIEELESEGDILMSPDETFLDRKAITKTGLEYAKHLIAQRGTGQTFPDNAAWSRAVIDAITARAASGDPLKLRLSRTRAANVETPAQVGDLMQVGSRGDLVIRQGEKWVAMGQQEADALAQQFGIPMRAESVPATETDSTPSVADQIDAIAEERGMEITPDQRGAVIAGQRDGETVEAAFDRIIHTPAARETGAQMMQRSRDFLAPFTRDSDAEFDATAGKDLRETPVGRRLADRIAEAEGFDARKALADEFIIENGRKDGVEYGMALDAEGMPLGIMSGRKSGVSFHTAIWRAAADGHVAYVTHNHPESGGFSPADIAMGFMNFGTIKAIAHDGTHHEFTPAIAFRASDRQGGIENFVEVREIFEPIFTRGTTEVNHAAWGLPISPDQQAERYNRAIRPLFGLILDRMGVINYSGGTVEQVNAEGFNFEDIYGQVSGFGRDRLRRAGLSIPEGRDRPRDHTADGEPGSGSSERASSHRSSGKDGEPSDTKGRVQAEAVTEEAGADGKPQAVMPGMERSEDQAKKLAADQARREMEARHQQSKIRRPGGNSGDAGPLFGDELGDLFDSPRTPAAKATAESGGTTLEALDQQAERETPQAAGEEQAAALPSLLPQEKAERKEKIEDFGEKLGGARKDTAVSRGPSGRSGGTSKSDQPAWRRQYSVNQIVKSMNPAHEGKWAISGKDGRHIRAGYQPMLFDTEGQAEVAIPMYEVAKKHRVYKENDGTFAIYRRVTDRKRVQMAKGFKTQDEANLFMAQNAVKLIETNTRIDDSIHPALEQAIRLGEARRANDSDVGPRDFADVFGFRGVEFGEWNNASERQLILNQAYDALLDFAEILKVPPLALSLNGELGLAFGARGHGLSGARAHYERNYGVINLTKIQGAGSLAHEWWHAFDHYLGRQDGKASSKKIQNERGDTVWDAADQSKDYASHGFLYRNSQVRPEVRDAMKQVVQTAFKRRAEYTEDTSTREVIADRTVKALDQKLDQFREALTRPQSWGRKKAAATAEQLAEIDKAIARIRKGDLGELQFADGQSRQIVPFQFYEPVMDIIKVYKAVRGRQGFGRTQSRRTGEVWDIQQAIENKLRSDAVLADAKEQRVKEKTVSTEFYSEAWILDQGRAGDYWITNHEMTARAFEAYVYDRLKAVDARNDFLAYEKHNNLPEYRAFNVKPYPEGNERDTINEAFAKLFDTMQNRETVVEGEGGSRPGVQLYSLPALGARRDRSPAPEAAARHQEAWNDLNARLRTAQRRAEGNEAGSPNRTAANQEIAALEGEMLALEDAMQRGSEAPPATARDIAGDVSEIMRAHGLEGRVSARVVNGLLSASGAPVLGSYRAGQINVNAGAADPGHVLRHEVIHALRDANLWGKDYGLFSAAEWRALAAAARADTGLRSAVEKAYPDLNTRGQTEEMIAEMYADWATGRAENPPGALGRAFERIQSFFRAMASALRGNGFLDAGAVMRDIANGEIGGRGPDGGPGGSRNRDSDNGMQRNMVNTATKAFRDWFRDSKVVNADGSPMVVYHGTEAEFEAFDTIGGSSDQWFGAGSYFAVRKSDLEEHLGRPPSDGLNVVEAYLSLQKPFVWKEGDRAAISRAATQAGIDLTHAGNIRDRVDALAFREWAVSQGYDGVMVEGHDGTVSEIVAFHPSQIKSTDNRGTFDPNDDRMKYQRDLKDRLMRSGTKAKGMIGNLHWKRTPEAMSKMWSNWLTDAMGRNERFNLLGAVPGRPLFTELGKNLAAAQEYLGLKERMDAERNQWQSLSATTVDKWSSAARKNPEANERLMELMHDTTIAQIDPSKDDGWRHPADAEAEAALKNKATSKERKQWARGILEDAKARELEFPALKARFDRLPKPLRDLYAEIRDSYTKMADAEEEAVMENIRHGVKAALEQARREAKRERQRIADEIPHGPARTEAMGKVNEKLAAAEARAARTNGPWMRQLRQAFESNRVAGPYFPLARRGQYFAAVRDQEGNLVEFQRFETEAEQQKFAAEQRAADASMRVRTGVVDNGSEAREAADPRFVADVEKLLLDTGASREAMDAVWQRYLETMPGQSMRKNRIHRKGTRGYNKDAIRAFASGMFHGAHQIARLRYGTQMTEALAVAKEQAAEQKDANRAGFVVREMEKRHAFAMNPTNNPIVTSATSFAFAWYLAASPAAALVNASQTTVVGIPLMRAHYKKAGTNGVIKALTKASHDFVKGRGKVTHRVGGVPIMSETWSVENAPDLTPDERTAMQQGYERGVIDKTQAHDLAAVAESGVEYNPTREKVMRIIGWGFHHTERFNREVTYLASYRLARDQGLDHEAATRDAARMTWDVHFDYSNTSRPRAMTGDTTKMLLIFRNFSVNMLYRLFRDTHQAMAGASKEERAEARQQLVGVSLSMFAHAGIRGVWGYGLLTFMLGLFFGGDDEVDEWLQDALLVEGDGMGTAAWNWTMGLVLNGAPGHVTGMNLTERIGMPNLWFRGTDRDLEGNDWWMHYMGEMAGPLFSIPGNMLIGAGQIMEGHKLRGLEKMTPVAVRNPLRTARYSTEGVTTMNGDELTDGLNAWQLFVQANGFGPAEVAERYKINNRLKNREREIGDDRKAIMREIGDAVRKGEEIPEKAIDRMRRFNADYPEWAITSAGIRQSMRSRERASQRNEFGVSLNPKINDRLREERAPALYN